MENKKIIILDKKFSDKIVTLFREFRGYTKRHNAELSFVIDFDPCRNEMMIRDGLISLEIKTKSINISGDIIWIKLDKEFVPETIKRVNGGELFEGFMPTISKAFHENY
jgi:hypothetical protein